MDAFSPSVYLVAGPSLAVQLLLACSWALVWEVALKWVAFQVLAPFVRSRPWGDQWFNIQKKSMKDAAGLTFRTDEEAFSFIMRFVATQWQHGVGGALCIPAVLGFVGPVSSALARHGALSEVGWELQDTVMRFCQIVFGGEAGRAKNPVPLVVISAAHHVMGIAMVIPMNLYYGNNPYYHELVFLLQGAAFFAMGFQYYGGTLNVKKKDELRQMKFINVLVLSVVLWSRLIRYAYVGYRLELTFIADGNTGMVYGGGFALLSMGLMNGIWLYDAVTRFRKFVWMSPEDPDVEGEAVRAQGSFNRHRSVAPGCCSATDREAMVAAAFGLSKNALADPLLQVDA